MNMINFKNAAAALALGFAVAAAASPAMAAQKNRAHPGHAANAAAQRGFSANAQATDSVGGATMNKDRDAAIRECSGKANSMSQISWGSMQGGMFRTCMAGHGQME
jgi:hypothetical protein